MVDIPSPRLGADTLVAAERARMTTIRHGGIIFTELDDLADDPWVAAAPLRAAGAPHPFVLDGRVAAADGARWSFLGAAPARVLEARADDAVCPWARLRAAVDARRARLRRLAEGAPALAPGARASLPPFAAGGVGVLGYDLGRRLERLPALAAREVDLPDLWVAFHDAVAAIDHVTGRAFVCGLADAEDAIERLRAALAQRAAPTAPIAPTAPTAGADAPRSTFEPAAYRAAVARVREWIAAGHVYQVNLSQRFTVREAPPAAALYERLRALSPVPFGAFCDLGGGRAVLSASPERFLRVAPAAERGGFCVESWPIKGTRPRAPGDPARDAALAAELQRSEKDRAELAMIVDLVRNDLGRVAAPGSVRVEDVFRVESNASVHHLVATVSARLRAGREPLDAVQAAFPAGSITGAPKIRAMEIIEEIEPVRRGVYTGAIGWLADEGALDLNVAIRTLVHDGRAAHFAVGGGVVWDSDPAAEHQETLDKAAAFFALLGAPASEPVPVVAGGPAA